MSSSRRAVVVVLAPVLLAAGALVGCTPTAPASAPSASAPAPEPAAVAALVLTTTGVSLRDAEDAELSSVSYAAGPAGLVEVLSPVFASTPEVVASPVDTECSTPYSETRWGEPFRGFAIRDQGGLRLVGVPSWIHVDAAEVDGIAIRTEGGVAVGDPAQARLDALTAEQRKTLSEASLPGAASPAWVESPAGTAEIDGAMQPYGVVIAAVDDGEPAVAVLSTPRTPFSVSC